MELILVGHSASCSGFVVWAVLAFFLQGGVGGERRRLATSRGGGYCGGLGRNGATEVADAAGAAPLRRMTPPLKPLPPADGAGAAALPPPSPRARRAFTGARADGPHKEGLSNPCKTETAYSASCSVANASTPALFTPPSAWKSAKSIGANPSQCTVSIRTCRGNPGAKLPTQTRCGLGLPLEAMGARHPLREPMRT